MPLRTEDLLNGDLTFGHAGTWCIPNIGYTFSGAVAGASTYRLTRFQPQRDMTIVRMGFVTTIAATNNDAVDIGLYDENLVRLASSGATTGKANATAGPQSITIASTKLKAGKTYYAGFAYGAIGGTAATIVMFNPQLSGITTAWGSTAGNLEVIAAVSGATLPNPAVLTISSSVCYALQIFES